MGGLVCHSIEQRYKFMCQGQGSRRDETNDLRDNGRDEYFLE